MATKTTVSLVGVIAAALLWLAAPVHGVDPFDDSTPEERLEGAFFYLSKEPNYAGAAWIYDAETNKILGIAPWDAVKRRWTLITLNGKYFGYLQATMGTTKPPHFTQYLWYDKDNRYKGLFVARLGGRPVTPNLPFGELGGERDLYRIGNIPASPPEYEVEVDPLKRFPYGVDVSPVETPNVRSLK